MHNNYDIEWFQAKLLGLNAMKLMGLDVSKYWSNDEGVSVEEEEDVPQAKRLKLDSAGEPAVEVV